MLGVPDPVIAELVGEYREFDRGPYGFASRRASYDRRQIKQGKRARHE
jgi:hypothetical protein